MLWRFSPQHQKSKGICIRKMKPLLLSIFCILFTGCLALAQTPDDALARAREQFDARRYDDVIQTLRGLESSANENPEAAYLLGIAWYQKREYQRALPLLQVVIESGRQAPAGSPASRRYYESVQVVGLSHYLLGHLAESVPWLETAVAQSPNNNELMYTLGMAAIQSRQPDKARAAFARMFHVAPDSAAAHLLTAQMMIRVEFEEFADEELKKALEKDPRLPQAHYLLGQNAIYKSRYDEGIALMEKELQVNPNNAMAHYKIGDARTRQLKWDEAIVALQKSVWLYPFYSGPYILLGKSYLKKRDFVSAEGMLKRAIQFDPNNKSAHYLLAQVYQQSGRPADAKREFAVADRLQGGADPTEKEAEKRQP
jgi:tetratricopeptide (TPR) repeat protein